MLRRWMLTLACAGCGPVVGSGGEGSTGGGEPTPTTEGTSAGSTSGGPTTASPTTGVDPDSSGSSSGEPLDGPGCGVVPACDRGELVGSMRIESSAQIEDIAGYTSVTGWLEITGSDLECLDFLACLKSVGRDILVADNAQLRSLEGLDAVTAVGVSEDAGVIVADNDALTRLDGFGALASVHALIVESNASLERVTGFDALEVVERTLVIRFHPLLHDLGPLGDLVALGDECQITNNPMLCLSEAYAVCGDLEEGGDEGNSANNDDSCLGDAPPGFIPYDDEWSECNVWYQNCPPGQKCTWWANDGGNAWNAMRCVPVDPDAADIGESCTVEGSGVSGLDSCDVGQMCWNVDPETNVGECVALCVGNESAPFCTRADDLCSISGSGLALCLPDCDPLAQDCGPGEGCYPASDALVCAPDVSSDLGALGDPCEYINVCDPGLFCADAAAVPGCSGAIGCCSPFCDLDAPACPFPEQDCVPAYEPADARWGYEDIGFCMAPA